MKSFVTFIFLILFGQLIAQSPTPLEKGGMQFELTGKLINDSPVSPDCGIIAWAAVAEFETRDLPLEESKLYKSVPLIIPCPEMYGQNFFQSGKTYKMIVTTKKGMDYAISNETVLNKYLLDNRYWLVSIKKLE